MFNHLFTTISSAINCVETSCPAQSARRQAVVAPKQFSRHSLSRFWFCNTGREQIRKLPAETKTILLPLILRKRELNSFNEVLTGEGKSGFDFVLMNVVSIGREIVFGSLEGIEMKSAAEIFWIRDTCRVSRFVGFVMQKYDNESRIPKCCTQNLFFYFETYYRFSRKSFIRRFQTRVNRSDRFV